MEEDTHLPHPHNHSFKTLNNLSFNNVTKHYGKHSVLDGVSGAVSCGITGVLGPNGSGKTTLLRILAGLLPCESGEFFLDNERIDRDARSWCRRIGYLPQSPGLYERMSVYDYLDYMLLLSGWKERGSRRMRIEEVSMALNLHNHSDVPIGNLSGGTKQRAAIAQALVHKPDVIFLDEPTNNLDSEERQRFHDYLFAVSATKITFFIGHIVNELPSLCEKILILDGGRIIFHDSPGKLVTLAHGVIRQITAPRAEFERSLQSKLRVLSVEHNGDAVTARFDSRLKDLEGSIPVTPTLEEAYKVVLRF